MMNARSVALLAGVLALVGALAAAPASTFAQQYAYYQQMPGGPSQMQLASNWLHTSYAPMAAGYLSGGVGCGVEEGCGTAAGCGPAGQRSKGCAYVRADYLHWWTKGVRPPALVTTSPDGTAREDAGVLGLDTTTILYGDSYINDDARPGYRITLGVWGDCAETWAVEGDYFDLAGESNSAAFTGSGATILSRPFYNIQTAQQDAELVSFPTVLAGTVSVSTSEYFQSTGSWLRVNLGKCLSPCADPCNRYGYRFDLIGGYRFYRLDDSLTVHEDLTALNTPVTTTFDIHDRFRAENEFHGGEIGLKTEIHQGRWSMDLLAKMALGNNRQLVAVRGDTVTTIGSLTPVTDPGGLLSAITNIGDYERDQFTVIPQLSMEIGYQINCRTRAFVGYNVLYWAHVRRSADQIDTVVDYRNIPPIEPGGTIHPQAQLRNNDFWAQGINVGVAFRY